MMHRHARRAATLVALALVAVAIAAGWLRG